MVLSELSRERSLEHRRDRMFTDGCMAVEPVNRASAADAVAREMISENRVTSERRCGDEQRHERRAENFRSHANHTADAADRGRGIKRGTHFVMNMPRTERFELLQRGAQ